MDDNIYKELIDESIERYGTSKKHSLLINEKLRNCNKNKNIEKDKLKLTYRLGRKLTNAEIDKVKDEYRGKTGWKP